MHLRQQDERLCEPVFHWAGSVQFLVHQIYIMCN